MSEKETGPRIVLVPAIRMPHSICSVPLSDTVLCGRIKLGGGGGREAGLVCTHFAVGSSEAWNKTNL